MGKINIVYATNINLNWNNGATSHIHAVTKYLNKKNNLILLGPKYNLKSSKYKRYILKSFINLWIFIKLIYFKLSGQIDVMYSRQGYLFPAPAIIARLFSIKHIVEINGLIREEMEGSTSPKFLIKIACLFERFSYKHSKRIICNSDGLKKYIVEKYRICPTKIKVIGIGVDEKRFVTKQRSSRITTIGYVGGLQHWQGVDYLIKAFAKVLKNNPNLQLMIVGDGPEKENLETLTQKLKINASVNFVGQVNNMEIPSYMNKIDIGICYLNKFKEGKYGPPTKVYEYLACGIPTILSTIKGVEELFNKDIVLFVKPENHKDLSRKLIFLLQNSKELKRLKKNSRKFILQNYTWDNIGNKVEEIIKGVERGQ